jgi:hypothetical protein
VSGFIVHLYSYLHTDCILLIPKHVAEEQYCVIEDTFMNVPLFVHYIIM